MSKQTHIGSERIAIVGMAGRFPGATSVRDLWKLLHSQREATTWLTDHQLREAGVSEAEIANPNYVRASLPLPNMESFDAEFFGFTPKEAAILDPQHRQFFETVWEAFEDAGVDPQRFPGAVGVFAGAGQQAYYAANILSNRDLLLDVGHFLLRHTGNDKDFLPTRVSYLLNLQGPSLAVQTACSTSLVAVHLACQSLLGGECDMALAGGVTIELPQGQGYTYKPNEILSIDGHCRSFDKEATGTLFGSGVGVVVLRRLSDALRDGDQIRAIICGSAINNDGARKAGYLAPSVDGQAQAAAEALAMSDIDPATVSYVEAHGTGTIVGDPIELAALSRAYQSSRKKQFCGIGSIKSNIGHLDTAAGIASLIKVVLALEKKEIPATLHYSGPNPHFDLAQSPFYVVGEPKRWPRTATPRRAGVNSIGVGGTNAHVILEEAPALTPTPTTDSYRLLTLSAKSERSLDNLMSRWGEFLAEPPADFNLTDAAYTLRQGRRTFNHRCVIVAKDANDLARALKERDRQGVSRARATDKPEVMFMFAGGGAQFLGAGRQLLQAFPAFRSAVDACFAAMPASAPDDLRETMFAQSPAEGVEASVLQDPKYGLPALFVLEYALARLWISWGVKPAGLIGHSSGEYAAAAIAEVVSVRDALEIVCFRAKLFASLPAGAMTAVALSPQDLRSYAKEGIDVAAINAPQLCVASGPESSIEAFERRMSRIGVDARRLRIDVAAHSRMLDGVLDEFKRRLQALRFSYPKIPLISNLTGNWIAHSELTDADYWVRHLRSTVRFSDGVRAALGGPNRILLETGPGQQLLGLARLNCTDEFHPQALVASTPQAGDDQPEPSFLANSAGRLWAHGVGIDLEAVAGLPKGRKISLPTYAFDKKRHWIEPDAGPSATKRRSGADSLRLTARADWFSETHWKQEALSDIEAYVSGAWLVFSDSSPTALALLEVLEARGASVAIVTIGAEFTQTERRFTIDPAGASNYTKLFEALAADGLRPETIIHLWSLSERGKGSTYPIFNSALAICRQLQLAETSSDRRLVFVTSGSQSIAGEPLLHPRRAVLLGAARVAPREIPGLRALVLDLDSPSASHAATLLREVDADLPDDLVAYRDEGRWTQRVSRISQNLMPPPGRLRQNGTYLITGGLGDIGLLLADFLVRAVSAKLILLGRTNLPPRGKWRETIQEKPHAKVASRIRAVLALEEIGAEVLVLEADIANETELGEALAKARKKFGRIDGLIHAAGTLHDAPISLKTAVSVRSVIGSKAIGSENLHRLLPEGAIDFFAVFASTSALAGISGQIDYAGANAVAAAIADSRRDGVTVYWGAWADIGVAARAYGLAKPHGEKTDHPLLGLLEWQDRDRACFFASYDPSVLWPAREHIVDGVPTLPASAYLEILNAAARILGYRKAVRVRNLSILAPMTFPENETRQVRISVKYESNGLDFIIESSSQGNSHVVEHARALVEPAPLLPLNHLDADTLRDIGKITVGDVLKAPQDDRLGFGPRWLNIRGLVRKDAKVIGVFVLPDAFADDRKVYSTHPALCDMAMSVGLSLIDADQDATAFYAPMSIDSAEFADALPSRVYSVATLVDRSDNIAVFDVKLTDDRQEPIGEMRGVAFRKVLRGAMSESARTNVHRDALLRSGIRADEATPLFDYFLRSDSRSIVVSPTPLSISPRRKAGPGADEASHTTVAQSDFSDPLEQALERIWRDLLGVQKVSPQDDFFALGGHSLIAVRLFARIRSEFSVDLPLASLFKAPRLPMLGKLIHDNATQTSRLPRTTVQAENQAPEQKTQVVEEGWTPLFSVRKGAPGKTPLFLIPGGDGGYFKLREIAPQMREDWPIYVLRMRGLEDSLPPHESIEALATAYIEGIRAVHPSGPYRLAGFSGGGVIAFEMALQLKEMGERVEAPIMFDTLCPDLDQKPRTFLERLWATRLWSRRYALDRVKELYRLPANILTGKSGGTSGGYSMQISDEPDRSLEKYFAMYAHYMRLQEKYRLRRLDSDLVLLRASGVPTTKLKGGRFLGWERWVTGRITTHRIDCEHHTLLLQPAISSVAKIVEGHLRARDDKE